MLFIVFTFVGMKTLRHIEKEINSLLKDAEVVINESKAWKSPLALSMLLALKRKVKNQFININQYLKDEK